MTTLEHDASAMFKELALNTMSPMISVVTAWMLKHAYIFLAMLLYGYQASHICKAAAGGPVYHLCDVHGNISLDMRLGSGPPTNANGKPIFAARTTWVIRLAQSYSLRSCPDRVPLLA